ncbi:MAG: SRPBCC family protein [Candidatus Dormibacteraeota bacterium]|nr:SRPBCC family protein [Candidatus Dormibacteraeota bacterium]
MSNTNAAAPDDVVSVQVAADPNAVYELVSDVTNMPRWSPETYRTRWIGGATGPAVGARFRGTNKWHFIRWTTTVEVEVADPGREFTFCTVLEGKKRTRWSYTFEPKDGGTLLTESRYRLSIAPIRGNFDRLFMRGHQTDFQEGMRVTLERIRAAAELAAVTSSRPV